jgi:hypothetical protein
MNVRKTASMFELATHDFTKTFRRLPEGITELEFFKALIARRESKERSFARAFGLSVLLVAICSIGGLSQEVNVKTPFVTIEIPKIYLIFIAAYTTAMSIYELLSYLLLFEFQRLAGNRLSMPHTNASMLAVPFGSVAEWTFLPLDRFDIIKVKRNYFGEFSALAVIIIPIICLYFSIYIGIAGHVIHHFNAPQQNIFMGNLLAALTILVAPAPLVFLPFPFRQMNISKNLKAIRWRFLYQMHRKSGTQPPAMAQWRS